MGYLLIEVHGTRAVVKLVSKPFQASANEIFLPFPTPYPIKLYVPVQLFRILTNDR